METQRNKEFLEDRASDIAIMLQTLQVPSRRLHLVRESAVMYLCEMFGVIFVASFAEDNSYILGKLNELYPDYKYFIVSAEDGMSKMREDIILNFMKAGYMHYIRINFPHHFTNLIVMQGYSEKIINERLRIWNDKPCYKYLISEHKKVKNLPATMVLAREPAFYDYMPE